MQEFFLSSCLVGGSSIFAYLRSREFWDSFLPMNSTLHVYKFGGASVKDAAALRNLYTILQSRLQTNKLIVVSAMGKTTNALEAVLA